MTFRFRAASRAAAFLLSLPAFACSLEEGLRKTPTVLSPDQVATIEGPGERLVAGSFHSLTSRSGMLMARRSDGPSDALTVVDPQHETWCELQNAERFVHASTGWLAYTASDSNLGEIHFANGDCTPLPAVVTNATMPYDVTEDGEAVMVLGTSLVAINPKTEKQRVLASGFGQVQQLSSRDQDGYVWLVKEGDQLIEFDSGWRERARVGEKVGEMAMISSPPTLVFEDNGKLKRATVEAKGELSISVVAEDGCRPRAMSSEYLTYLGPCGNPTLHSLSGRGGQIDWGPLGVEPDQAVVISKKAGPLRLYFLREVDPSAGTGTLWTLDDPKKEPKQLAERAALSWVQPGADESIYALVDIQDNLGRVVHIAKDGVSDELVTFVPRNGGNEYFFGRGFWFFAHPADDGSAELVRICALAGCASGPSAPAVETIARGVPDWGFAASLDAEHVAVLHDVAKGMGTLSTDAGALVAEGVPQGGFSGLYPMMERGIAYLTRFDAERAVGSLEYWNLALDARGTVAENVSEFIRADWPYMGLVYLVPSGDNAGLWYARGK